MTDKPNEKPFREYLDGQSPVSEAYRSMPQSEPSPELDRAVLATARAAIGKDRQLQSDRLGWQRWMMPTALAATVALCVALVAEVVLYNPLLQEAETPFPSLAVEPQKSSKDQAAAAGRVAQTPTEPAPAIVEMKRENLGKADAAMQMNRATEPARDRPESLAMEEMAVEYDALEMEQTSDSLGTSSAAQEPLLEPPQANLSEEIVVTARKSGLASPGESGKAKLDWPAPDVWLAGIRFLEAEGDEERADAELRKFRQIYPDYPLERDVQPIDE